MDNKKKMNKQEMGRKARRSGATFERKTRAELETKWIVSRWQNDVDLENNKLIPARSRFGMRTTGLPDFICFRIFDKYEIQTTGEKGFVYEVIGVECKSRKYLDKTEKQKVKWLLDNHIFSRIEVAFKGKKRGKIVYEVIE